MQHPVVGSEEGKEERAVPGMTDLGNVCKHIARYNVALLYAHQRSVFDAACGCGYGSFLLGTVARSVRAVDISPAAIEYAQQNFAHPAVQYECGDVVNLQGSAEMIISFETIEHLEDPRAFEDMLLRCLAPQGCVIYSLPLNESPGDNPYHRHTFTYEQARSVFPRLKLRDEQIQHGINFYPPRQVPLRERWLAYIGVAQRE